MTKLRFISLFGGIGGFDLPLIELGHSCVGYYEIDKYAVQIYNKNFGTNYKPIDITEVKEDEIPDHDLLVAGFPCQPFSIAGKHKGFEDTRGTLFFEIARIARARRPEYLLLENVIGLLSHDNGRTFGKILSTLDELGYDAEWEVLNSRYFGVPQNRERVFIIGHLRGEPTRKVFPIYPEGKAYPEMKVIENIFPSGHNAGDIHDVKGSMKALRTKSDNYIWDGERIRRLTPLECERLQGFPDGWTEGVSDTQRYKMLGNAVTVNVVREIVKRLEQVK